MRLAIASAIRLYRDGLATSLGASTSFDVVATAVDVEESLPAIVAARPDVVLLDASGPRSVAAVRTLAGAIPDTRVVALAVVEAEADVIPLAEAGVAGYLTVDQSLAELTETILAVARGANLANWDDDDWISPRRLSAQVAALTAAGGDVCGLNRILYYEPATGRAWRYVYPWDPEMWASDGTLLYTRALWEGNRFPDTSTGVDLRFLRAGRFRKLVPLDDETVYVGIIHGENTSRKHTRQSVWHPIPSERIHALCGDDLEVYAAAGRPLEARPASRVAEVNPR